MPTSASAYFYLTYNNGIKQKVSTFLYTVMAQIINQRRKVLAEVEELWKNCNEGNEGPVLHRLRTSFPSLVNAFTGAAYLVVDAFDEYPENDDMRKILLIIAGIHALALDNIHILLSSRREPGIERALWPVITSPALCIETSQLETDIEIYVRSELSSLNFRL